DPPLLAGGHGDAGGPGDRCGEVEDPRDIAGREDPGIVEDDELLGEVLAGPGVVLLAGDVARLAGDVGEPGSIVGGQGPAVRGGGAVGAGEGEVHAVVGPANVVGDEAGALEVLPVDGQVLTRAVNALSEPPEVIVFPGGGRRDPQRAEGAEVVGEVAADDLVAV